MDWLREVSNFDELPKTKIFYVAISYGKANYYRDVSAFAEKSKVIGFETQDVADYFIEHFVSSFHDFREAMPDKDEDYRFWVFDKTPRGYYADYIWKRTGEKYGFQDLWGETAQRL